jgi:hypothetical protein
MNDIGCEIKNIGKTKKYIVGGSETELDPEHKERTDTTKSARISKRFPSPRKSCLLYTKDEASLL